MKTDSSLDTSDARGAAAIEYALLAGLISVLIILGAAAVGVRLDEIFNGVADAF